MINNNTKILGITFLERFSYYIFMSMVILFLIEEKSFSHEKSFKLYEIFKVSVYVLPIIVGLVSDFVNRTKFLKIGILISGISYFLMPFATQNFLLTATILISLAAGTAITKTNLPVLLGDSFDTSKMKVALRNYQIFAFMILIGSIAAVKLDVISITNGSYTSAFVINSAVILVAFVIASRLKGFKRSSNNNAKVDKGKMKFLLIPLILVLTSLIVRDNILTLTTEVFEELEFNFHDFVKLPFLLSSIILVIVYSIKRVKMNFKVSRIILISTVLLSALFTLFLLITQWGETTMDIGKAFTISFVYILFDTIILPFISVYIYRYSNRFKGLMFGFYYSILAFVSIGLFKIELKTPLIIFASFSFIIVGIGLLKELKKNDSAQQ